MVDRVHDSIRCLELAITYQVVRFVDSPSDDESISLGVEVCHDLPEVVLEHYDLLVVGLFVVFVDPEEGFVGESSDGLVEQEAFEEVLDCGGLGEFDEECGHVGVG